MRSSVSGHGGERIVEHTGGRIDVERAGEGDALLLSTGKRNARSPNLYPPLGKRCDRGRAGNPDHLVETLVADLACRKENVVRMLSENRDTSGAPCRTELSVPSVKRHLSIPR
jgi:hypothetical protein